MPRHFFGGGGGGLLRASAACAFLVGAMRWGLRLGAVHPVVALRLRTPDTACGASGYPAEVRVDQARLLPQGLARVHRQDRLIRSHAIRRRACPPRPTPDMNF